jgi:hypothetical protein
VEHQLREHLIPRFEPLAYPAAVTQAGATRFTVLKSRLIRMEFSPAGIFEDRPSQVVWHRRQPVTEYEAAQDSKYLEIETSHLKLRCDLTARDFTAESLSIQLKSSGLVWHYGDKDHDNLPGTTRTLDRVLGSTRLEPSLVSRRGWSLLDDSGSLVFNQSGWLEPRDAPPRSKDLYFFGYGHDFRGCLRAYGDLAGTQGLLPRWALGSWWSRYWPYRQEEFLQLMEEFNRRKIPISVCMVDMDWHITDTGNACSGWTGYTWNRTLFPDPEAFLSRMHTMGLKVSLNLHPAEGIHPHEEVYPQMAERLGLPADSRIPIQFDIADPLFAQAYLEVLHHPLEEMGVDFWWVDWQQGERSSIQGLDPLWWLNHLHYLDSSRDESRRPLILSRWGGMGSHRYPVGFSGDTIVNWDSLAFQPGFTASAANVGYGWWSHDIGGHMYGIEEPELYARWVQFGVFSPILRLHSSNSPFQNRLPWGFDDEILHVARSAMQLRQALIPYVYTAAWHSYKENLSLVRPMYYTHSDHDEAYRCPGQYWFGSELIVAPFTSPRDPDTQLSHQQVWLPEGNWYDFISSQCYDGDRWVNIYGNLETIPVFARSGAIIPISIDNTAHPMQIPADIEIHIFPGESRSYTLYEDDGESQDYLRGQYCLTEFRLQHEANSLAFTIKPPQGRLELVPEKRRYIPHFHAITRPESVQLKIDGKMVECAWSYEAHRETAVIQAFGPQAEEAEIILQGGTEDLFSQRDRFREKLFALLARSSLETLIKEEIFSQANEIQKDVRLLDNFTDNLKASQIQCLKNLIEDSAPSYPA